MNTTQKTERPRNATVQLPRDTWVQAKHRAADLEIPLGEYLDRVVLEDLKKHPR